MLSEKGQHKFMKFKFTQLTKYDECRKIEQGKCLVYWIAVSKLQEVEQVSEFRSV